MWLVLASLALALSSAEKVSPEVAASAAEDARIVALEHDYPTYESSSKHASLLLVTGWIEGRWLPAVNGPYIGSTQVDRYVWASLLTPERVQKVLSTRIDGFRLGLDVLDHLEAKCGSLRKAVYAYLSGHCSGKTSAIRALGDARCALAGGC